MARQRDDAKQSSCYCLDGTKYSLVPILRDESALKVAASLFRAHADGIKALGVDINEFQSFELELATLPGKYSPDQHGALWLAYSSENEAPAACVALRCHEWPKAAEIKRLYVAPEQRRRGLGRLLSLHAMQHAALLGYQTVLLDSLERQAPAVQLYESLGFHRTTQYIANPEADAVFMNYTFCTTSMQVVEDSLGCLRLCALSPVSRARQRLTRASAVAAVLCVAATAVKSWLQSSSL